jgi:transcriptional regulator with XRE-family HTH domain
MMKESSGVRFGREVRRRREAQSMTLEVLAERSGLTPNYVGGVETEKRDPSLSTVLALAQGLDVNPAELFGTLADIGPAATEAGRLFDLAAPEIQRVILAILRATVKILRK